MNARDALKNYHNRMVAQYGPDYVEHWSQDDKETFEILARRARKAMRSQTGGTSFLKVFMSGKREPQYTTWQDRQAAWKAFTDRHGKPGYRGKLSPEKNLYAGPGKDPYANIAPAPEYVVDPETMEYVDRNSSRYVTGVTAADLLRSVRFSD